VDHKSFIEDKKIEIGIVLIFLNFAIGFVSKIPFLQLIADPSSFSIHPLYYISAVVAYLFSWCLGILGVILIGKETYDALRSRMQKQVHDTYQEHIGKHVDKHVKPKMEQLVHSMEKKRKEKREKILQKGIDK